MKWDWLNLEKDDQTVGVNGSIPAISKWQEIHSFQQAPRRAGVYALKKEDQIVYIGESAKIQSRLKEHELDEEKDFNKISWLQIDGYQRKFIEQMLIAIYGPIHNKEMTKHDRRMFLKDNLNTTQGVWYE